MRQITKVSVRMKRLENGEASVNRDSPRRCRTCFDSNEICDGLCWGFWKHSSVVRDGLQGGNLQNECDKGKEGLSTPRLPISIGSIVEPGPAWNEIRHGRTEYDRGHLLRGQVVEIKSWGSGGNVNDCVAVVWFGKNKDRSDAALQLPKIYRWGAIARNGTGLYDVKLVDEEEERTRE